MKILFYGANRSPVREFIERLPAKDCAKVLACLKSIEDMGWYSPRVQFRQLKGKLWEIKIKSATAGYRIFYVTLQKEGLVLLHAYQKQSQKAPAKELAIAEKRLLEVIQHASDYLN
jgi:phage-related protein